MRISRGPAFWAIAIFCGVAAVLFGMALAEAQELEATITYKRTSVNNAFSLVVLNSSPVETIETVTVSMQDGLRFDVANGNPEPGVGGNNDANKSTTLTWTKTLATGQLLRAGGDVDGNAVPKEIIATVGFTSAGARTVTLIPSGAVDTWTAQISESASPGLPIISGQATATLSWVRPTERVDGTPLALADIAGYVLYWGASPRVGNCGTKPTRLTDPCYGNVLQLPDGTLETKPLTLSLAGDTTIYFAMIAYTISVDGKANLSKYSNEVPKAFTVVVQQPPEAAPGAPTMLTIDMQVTCTTDQVNVTCSFSVN